jgi:hypothetical protein
MLSGREPFLAGMVSLWMACLFPAGCIVLFSPAVFQVQSWIYNRLDIGSSWLFILQPCTSLKPPERRPCS